MQSAYTYQSGLKHGRLFLHSAAWVHQTDCGWNSRAAVVDSRCSSILQKGCCTFVSDSFSYTNEIIYETTATHYASVLTFELLIMREKYTTNFLSAIKVLKVEQCKSYNSGRKFIVSSETIPALRTIRKYFRQPQSLSNTPLEHFIPTHSFSSHSFQTSSCMGAILQSTFPRWLKYKHKNLEIGKREPSTTQ